MFYNVKRMCIKSSPKGEGDKFAKHRKKLFVQFSFSVLHFNTFANEIGCFKVLFHIMFVNVYHHLQWCWYSAHVVRRVNTYGAEG